MRCLPECNFAMLPSNGPILVQHMQDCDLSGPLKDVKNPVVVWRDGGFAVVAEPNEGEQTYDIGFVRMSHEIKLPILDIDLVDGFNTAFPEEEEAAAAVEEAPTTKK